MKIICMGDSITYGFGLPDLSKRWSDLVSARTGHTLINRGISGDTTGGMLARCQTQVFNQAPDAMVLLGGFLVSLEGLYDVETNLTAALTCVSNVGPGLGSVGPVENFAGYGPFATIILSLLMLAGRLELFPILALFHPAMWKK